MITKVRVKIKEQWKDFSDINEAREAAVKTLESGIVSYIDISAVEVKEEAA